jgi:hypothetical protein
MKSEFEMSLLGELSFFLGLQIRQSNQGIFISQTKYIREMLKRFGMEDCKPVITPMQTSCKLSKDDDSKSTDQRQYRSRTYLLNIEDPTSPMQSKLCHKAYGEIFANKHKPMKTRIT